MHNKDASPEWKDEELERLYEREQKLMEKVKNLEWWAEAIVIGFILLGGMDLIFRRGC